MSNYTQEEYRLMALAAGYEINFVKSGGLKRIACFKDENSGDLISWIPDIYYDDCFRLMVDAGITVGFDDSEDFLVVAGHLSEDIQPDPIKYKDDKRAATRKAICDCAIKIGRHKEEGL